jgi:soluble lytic murein transglycosylase
MARVPQYEQQQQLRALPGVRQNIATPAAAFGDGGAFAQNIGQGLEQGAEIMAREQLLADEVRVDEQLNKWKEYQLDLTFNPESGYTTQKGAQAMYRPSGKPLADEYYENADKYSSDLENSLGTDRQKAMFRQKVTQQLTGFKGDLMRYEGQEFRSYQVSVQEGKIATEARTVASYYNNPDKVNESIAEIKKSVYLQGRLEGKSAEEIAARTDAMVSAAHAGALDQALGNGSPLYADQYLKTYKDQMTPQDLLKARSKIGEQVETVVATKTADLMFGKVVSAENPTDMDRVINITMQSESNGRRYGPGGQILTSKAGAKGEMQVMDPTNGDPGFGVTPARDDSPDERARVGRDYMGAMVKKYEGDLGRAWAAYNAGPGAVDKAMDEARAEGSPGAWLSKLPKETQDYVRKNATAYGSGQGKPKAPTVDELKAELRQRPEFAERPNALRKAEDEIDRRFADYEKGRKARQEGAYDEAIRMIDQGGSFESLPPAMKRDMDAGKFTSLREYEKKVRSGTPVETDLSTYQLLATNPQRVRDMSDAEFNALKTSLSSGDFKKFSDMRADKVNAKDNPQGVDFEAVNQVLTPRLRGMGIPQSGVNTIDAQRSAAIRQHIADVVLQRQQQLGRKLTDAELIKTVDERFLAMRTSETSAFGQLFGGDKVRKQNVLRSKVGDIPGDVRKRIERDLNDQGIDSPTDQDLLTAYFGLDYQIPQ